MREIETKTLKSPNTKSPKCYSKFLQLDTWVVGGTVGDGGRVGLAWWKQLGSVTCGDGLVVWLWSDSNMVMGVGDGYTTFFWTDVLGEFVTIEGLIVS
jgi:hypothetical protein